MYTFERRVEIMIGVLNALEYAHANGVVHRDIKPANVMVGRYGEVMLMDWGIAKPMEQGRDLARGADGTLDDAGERGRMYMTHVGSLVGTPAYMSPEQARGEVDRLDARSDLYSACVVLHELITLRHYLADERTTADVLGAVITREMTRQELQRTHPAQGAHPPELLYIAHQGLAKEPDKRAYTSASQLIEALQETLSGKIQMQCTATMTKRFFREAAKAVDRRPRLVFSALLGIVVAVLFAVFELVRLAIA